MYGVVTINEASDFLGITKESIRKKIMVLNAENIKIDRAKGGRICINHEVAKRVFKFNFNHRIIALQIVKGGTGKTSLTHAIAIKMSLLGAKVLCIDLDQQGNLTQALNINSKDKPIMADFLSGNYPELTFNDLIVNVTPGLDLIPSRIENATLDNIIMLKRYNLEKVYSTPLKELKPIYDLIIIDCPPALGQSVTAVALACDTVIAPVAPEDFSLSGLVLTYQEIDNIKRAFDIELDFRVLLNKFDPRTTLSYDTIKTLAEHGVFGKLMYNVYVRNSQEFPNAIAKRESIFDVMKETAAKSDIDLLLAEIFPEVPEKSGGKNAIR